MFSKNVSKGGIGHEHFQSDVIKMFCGQVELAKIENKFKSLLVRSKQPYKLHCYP